MKHLVCVIDGTWLNAANRPSFSNYSNAYAINCLLADRAKDAGDQVVFYSSGLGATGLLQDYTAGAFAEGIDQQIRDAYINICSNFRETKRKSKGVEKNVRDKIYIFGFSRGAVAARALCGIISEFGLLKPTYIKFYPKLWSAYTGRERPHKLDQHLLKDIEIEFVGLFDSVFGARNRASAFKSLSFRDFNLASGVKNCVHLLALDDRRVAFAPMLFQKYDQSRQSLEQIWLPGVHSDVGGTSSHDFLGRCALHTMIDRVSQYTKLKFNPTSVTVSLSRENKDIHITNECVGLWRLSITRYRRPEPGEGQFIHPLAYKISGRLDTQYGRRRSSYAMPPTFKDTPTPTFIGFADRRIEW